MALDKNKAGIIDEKEILAPSSEMATMPLAATREACTQGR
jgi:hypothetical protein